MINSRNPLIWIIYTFCFLILSIFIYWSVFLNVNAYIYIHSARRFSKKKCQINAAATKILVEFLHKIIYPMKKASHLDVGCYILPSFKWHIDVCQILNIQPFFFGFSPQNKSIITNQFETPQQLMVQIPQ